jgi:uncharacterized protein (DUF305 family)
VKNYFRLGLLALAFAAVVLTLASCGGPGEDRQGGSNEGMQGMNHGGTTAAEETTGGTTGMEMGSGGMAEEMLMEDGEYSDLRFIDAMVPHHEGAVEMATVALVKAEHEEVRRLAEDIVSAQRAEIDTLRGLWEREFGSAEPAMQMPEEEMNGMMGMADPRELTNAEPFDKAFIDAMIPHHESAIAMAEIALRESENEEIRTLAQDIVDAQRREIEQMNTWRERWYPEG